MKRLWLPAILFVMLGIPAYLSVTGGALAQEGASLEPPAPETFSWIIRDDATGGDCAAIGAWDTALKTCTLTCDLALANDNGGILIYDPGITLNGNNFVLSRSAGTFYPIDDPIPAAGNGSVPSGSPDAIGPPILPPFPVTTPAGIRSVAGGATIKDIGARGFGTGIQLLASGAVVTGSRIENNSIGIQAGDGNILLGVPANANSTAGQWVSARLENNLIAGNGTGLQCTWCGDSQILSNSISGNNKGMRLDNLVQSTVSGNQLDSNESGLDLADSCYISCSESPGNVIDTTNLIDGKPVYYLEHARNRTFDASTDAAAIYCYDCSNITIRDMALTSHSEQGIYLVHTTNSVVENVDIQNYMFPLWLQYSQNNLIKGNRLGNDGFGLRLFSSQNNSLVANIADPTHQYAQGLNAWDASHDFLAGNELTKGMSISGSQNQAVGNRIMGGLNLSDNSAAFNNYITDGGHGIVANGGIIAFNKIGPGNNVGLYLLNNENLAFNNEVTGNSDNLRVVYAYRARLSQPQPVGGNYWSDYDTPEEGCLNQDGDAFCDAPYTDSGAQPGSVVHDAYPYTAPDLWPDQSSPAASTPRPGGVIFTENPIVSMDFADAGNSGISLASVSLSVNSEPLTGCTVDSTSIRCPTALHIPSSYQITGTVSDMAGNTTTVSGSFSIAREYYLPFYDNNRAWGMNGDWVCISNLNYGSGTVDIFIGNNLEPVATFDLGAVNKPTGHIEWQAPSVITDGPVRIVSRTGAELLVSQRTIYRDSFNETMAVASTSLDSEYYFNWYDNNHDWGMNGDWIAVTNLGNDSTNAQIYLGDNPEPAATISLPLRGHAEWQSPDVFVGGPVRVVSDNGQQLLVGQRVIFNDSFTESMGIPRSAISNEAYFTWYDNNRDWDMNGDWICVTNVGDAGSTVKVYVGDRATPETMQYLSSGAHMEWSSPRVITNGPVRVVSDDGQPIVVSQRSIYKRSFEEVQGVYTEQLGSEARFPWYDSKTENGMKGNWIVAGNPADTQNWYRVTIGGSYLTEGFNGEQGFVVPGHSSVASICREFMGGPIWVGGPLLMMGSRPDPLIISQRVIYKDSFNEVVGRLDWPPSNIY